MSVAENEAPQAPNQQQRKCEVMQNTGIKRFVRLVKNNIIPQLKFLWKYRDSKFPLWTCYAILSADTPEQNEANEVFFKRHVEQYNAHVPLAERE